MPQDAPHLTWKPNEPSNDPLKACVAVEYNNKVPPYLTFYKESCTVSLGVFSESNGPVEKDFFYPHMNVQPKV
jgi:hypothetical protein